MKSTRRSFLKKVTAFSAAPFILPSNVWSSPVKPSDEIVMGFIGMGKQSRHLLRSFINNKACRVVAVCDVDTTRLEDALQTVNAFYTDRPERGTPDCKAYVDFREVIARDDINAVCIATPDHWHAIPVLDALRSGKDVYCEKPLTHNIHEAIEIMEAVEKHDRVLQTGSMQRSMEEFRVACELVQNGFIGKIDRVECSFGPPGKPCDLPEETLEPGLDWEMWIGPGPMRPYSSVLSPRGMHDHFPAWRDYKEYGGGMVCDWGAHHLDIAQWGLGMDESGPKEIIPPQDPKAERGAEMVYKNGVRVIHKDGFGVEFYGDEGQVNVNRGRFEFYLGGEKITGFNRREEGGSLQGSILKVQEEYLKDARVRLYASDNHMQDFIDCVYARRKPITNEIVGGRSAICCHLMNQAYYNHETIQWWPDHMRFPYNRGESEWLTRDYRAPWTV